MIEIKEGTLKFLKKVWKEEFFVWYEYDGEYGKGDLIRDCIRRGWLLDDDCGHGVHRIYLTLEGEEYIKQNSFFHRHYRTIILINIVTAILSIFIALLQLLAFIV